MKIFLGVCCAAVILLPSAILVVPLPEAVTFKLSAGQRITVPVGSYTLTAVIDEDQRSEWGRKLQAQAR